MSDYAVSINDLTRRFGRFVAVNRISLQVRAGEIFTFLGPNGAGKSTTIKMLTGLLRPSSGNGIVAGFDICRQAEKIKEKLGYMSQRFSLYNDLTPLENLYFYAGIYKVPRIDTRKREEFLCETTGLGRLRNMPTGALPLGLKQRLALECAMLHHPPILFLDEPTAGVDPLARREFWEIIYAAAQSGTTVFLTTHYMDEAEHADRVGMIFSGQLKAVGTPADLKQSFGGGAIFQFRAENLISTLNVLAHEPQIRQAALFGSTMHLTFSERLSAENVALILQRLGIKYSGLRQIQPTLEDVFIDLTSRESAS